MTPRALGCALLCWSLSAAAQTSQTFVVTTRASGKQLAAASFGNQNVALSDFALHFSESDPRKAPERPLGLLALLPQKNGVEVAFDDGSGKSEFSAQARYLAVGSGVTVADAGRQGCVASCMVPIPRPPDNQAFALVGFELVSRSGGSKLSQIAVQLVNESSSVRFVFASRGAPKSQQRFDARVRYTLIPKSLLAGYYTVSGEFDKTRTSIERRPGRHLLQGFSLELKTGEQLLHRIAIVGAGKPKFDVALRDQRGDGAYRASIDYVILK